MPDIRERNDRPKDKQPKHQAASTVQRQMVQKFVKELGDSAKQSDRSNSAETTATEQVEMTAREIVHEAAPFPRKAHHRTNAPHTRPERPQPQSVSTPTPQEQGRRAYVRRAIITTGRAGGLHRPPWGLLPAEPIGSSNLLSTA